jgi:hypothetical protein
MLIQNIILSGEPSRSIQTTCSSIKEQPELLLSSEKELIRLSH